MAKRSRRLTHDRSVYVLCLAGGLPAVLISCYWIWTAVIATDLRVATTLLVIGSWLGFASAVRERVTRPLQTMSNLLLALREGDFSFRARGAKRRDPLGDVLDEINGLGDILQTNRRGAMEATALLSAVISAIDVAIFAFDGDRRLRLVNPAGQKLLGQPAARLLGRHALAIGLEGCLDGEPDRILDPAEINVAAGRWNMRRITFRQDGKPHELVVFGDLSRPLREEQLKAWQHLVRVLGHEINNSLAPIKSIASSLGTAIGRASRSPDLESDIKSGLGIIASRSEALERFLQGYTQLARLPPPTLASCDIASLVRRVSALELRLGVDVKEGPAVSIMADAAQVEQAVINLTKNAVEASIDKQSSRVAVSWLVEDDFVEIRIEDEGHGIDHATSLFVPFFTTKPDGSGIGLVLSQNIAENHQGSLVLRNRETVRGCVAILRLPIGKHS